METAAAGPARWTDECVRPYVSIAERENRFLHSAVACAPAPVGMTKQGRGVVCASVGMTMVGSIFILKKPGADGELGVVKDSGVREPGWPILSRSLRKGGQSTLSIPWDFD